MLETRVSTQKSDQGMKNPFLPILFFLYTQTMSWSDQMIASIENLINPSRKRKKVQVQSFNENGVSFSADGRRKPYISRIFTDGKYKSLGSYGTLDEAAKAYDKEAIKLRRPISKLNFPKKAPVGYTPIQKALTSRNTVGYRGVSKRGKNYQAQIFINGKLTHLGIYDTAKEAAIAYDRAVLKANQSTTLLNFPDAFVPASHSYLSHPLEMILQALQTKRRK